MKPSIFHCTNPENGQVFTRTSQSHVYTHAVLVRSKGFPDWGPATWASSARLADKKVAEYRRFYDEVMVVEVTEEIK